MSDGHPLTNTCMKIAIPVIALNIRSNMVVVGSRIRGPRLHATWRGGLPCKDIISLWKGWMRTIVDYCFPNFDFDSHFENVMKKKQKLH